MILMPMVILTIDDDNDRAYMTRLYREYRALMLKTAWEYSNDNETVEDIVSESCIALIRHMDQLKGMEKAAIRSYIVITVRNKAIDDFRKQSLRKRVFVAMDENTINKLTEPNAFDRKLNLRHEMDAVKEAIAVLPAEDQDVLRLKFFQHLSDKEIAAQMEITENRVRVLIRRARKQLKKMLYDDVELEWTSHMDSELICVEVDDLKGFVRRATGETVIPCQLDPLYRYGFDGDYCAALPADADDPNAWILFDRQGNQVPLPENCFISNGSMVVHCEELIPVRNAESGLYGYIDGTGKLVIPCQYLYAFEFRDGRACVVLNEEEGAEEWAVITPENDIVLRRRGQANSRSGSGYYTHGLLPLGMDADGSVPFVDRDGNEVFRLDIPGLTSIHEFKENGVAFYVAKIDSPGYEHGVGLFNMQGEVLTPPIFLIEESDWYEEFSDGLFPVTEIATLKMGYIDERGEWAFPPVDGYCQEFRDGLARINLYPDVIFVNREGNELYRYVW